MHALHARLPKNFVLEERLERYADSIEASPERWAGQWAEACHPLGSERTSFDEVRLDMGCGKGAFTVEAAAAEKSVLFVGIDFEPICIAYAAQHAVEAELPNMVVAPAMGTQVVQFFGTHELSRIYINFPDPWKKSGQKKRRLTFAGFLAIYANLLPTGGEIWFKSDNDPLFEWSLGQFESEGWELREVTRDLHANGPVGVMTDYEAKFYEQGVTINRLVAVKTEDTKCDLFPGMSTGSAPV